MSERVERPTATIAFILYVVGALVLLVGLAQLAAPTPNYGQALLAAAAGLAVMGLGGVNSRLADIIFELRLGNAGRAERAAGDTSVKPSVVTKPKDHA